jgi:hypothetical protein
MANATSGEKRPFCGYYVAWGLFLFLLVAMGVVLFRAPLEQTLGSGIRVVYLHVALIWASLLGLLLNGVLGLAVAVTERPLWERWRQLFGWLFIGLFILGVLVSLWAQQVNWGGILWREPRNVSVFNVTAVALISQILADWSPRLRWRGLLSIALSAFILWEIPRAELVMHPGDPIGSSTSAGIQFTFYSLAILCFLAVLCLAWIAYRRKRD